MSRSYLLWLLCAYNYVTRNADHSNPLYVPLGVVANFRTGLDLRTGPYCCENTNLRTGLDQWTKAINGTWPCMAIRSTNESVQCPYARFGDSENDTRGRILVALASALMQS